MSLLLFKLPLQSASPSCSACPAGQIALTVGSSTCSYCPVSSLPCSRLKRSAFSRASSQALRGSRRVASVRWAHRVSPLDRAAALPAPQGSLLMQLALVQLDRRSYNSFLGSSSCNQCPAGRFANATGFTACLACPAGSIAASPGASSCTLCTTGRYVPFPAQTTCLDCASG